MKNQTTVDRIIASALVFFVIMMITLFALMPFAETLFTSEKITNLIIFGIPACGALLQFFYVKNIGKIKEQPFSWIGFILEGVTVSDDSTTDKLSYSFIVAVAILAFLLVAFLFGPVFFNLFT